MEKSGTALNQAHYQVKELQPVEVAQMHLSPEEFQGAMKFNVLKYILRLGHKDDPAKEADKACQYSKWLAQSLRGEAIDPREER